MNNERDIAMNTQPYAEDLGLPVERLPATVEVPDGTYIGRWCGDQVAHQHDGQAIVWETEIGVRGSCPVRFVVQDGKLVGRSIEQIGVCDGQPLLHGIDSVR